MKTVFLNPGEFHFDRAPGLIRTLLGSCVAVTLWHPRLRQGGMCHFMLPGRAHYELDSLDGRYAVEAFHLFDRAIARIPARPGEFQAKLFGGGNMFRQSEEWLGSNVARRNIDIARLLLNERGIGVVAEHVGGSGHRKLVFDLMSGEVRLGHTDLPASAAANVLIAP